MEGFFVLIGLAIVIGYILGIVGFFLTTGARNQIVALRREVAGLKADVASLTSRLQGGAPEPTLHAPAPDAQTAAAPATDLAPPPVEPVVPAPPPVPGEVQPPATVAAASHSETISDAPAPPPLPGTAQPAPPPLQTAKPKRGLLDELGARWSVWVGGIALALAAVVLLRYSIEAGFFGPGMRIILTLGLGFVALCAGEFLRRSGWHLRLEATQNAYVPGVLTAVGLLALFGAVYAAYALYGFIGPAIAFIVLGVLSLAALGLGLLQGPAVSGLGLAGSLATPLLIQSDEPNYLALYGYLIVVAAAAMLLARVRDWAWLSIAAAAGALGWALLGVLIHGTGELVVWLAYLAGLFALMIVISPSRLILPDGEAENRLHDRDLPLGFHAAAGGLLIAMLLYDSVPMTVVYAALAGAAAGFAMAWVWPRLVLAAASASVLAAAALVLRGMFVTRWLTEPFWPAEYTPLALTGQWGHLFAVAVIVSAAIAAVSVVAARRPKRTSAAIWAASGVAGPLVSIGWLWFMGAKGEVQLAFSLAGVGLAAVYGIATEWLFRSGATDDGGRRPLWSPNNIFAGGASAALAFGLYAGLDGLPLTLAFAAAAAAIAYATTVRDIDTLRMAVPAFGGLMALHVLLTLTMVPDTIGNAIIFNALWLYLAVPAAALALAVWLMSRQRSDLWSQGAEALALTFAALFAVFQVRHYMNGGDLFAPTINLEELSLQILVGLSFSLGLSRIREVQSGGLFTKAAMLAMAVSLINLYLGNLAYFNPLINPDSPVKGGLFFNSLLLAYLVPGLALAAIAWLQKDRRPDWYIQVLGATALLLSIVYVSAMVRLIWQGGDAMSLFDHDIANTEQYTYSIVWLIFGVSLLAGGLVFKNRELRIASAAVMVLTVAKVFLIDLSELEGVLRAVSLAGLGAVLIAMGLVYQRLLVQPDAPEEKS